MQESLIDWAEATLSTQSQILEKGAERICSFYHGVALSLEHHRRKEIDIDEVAAETMFNLKEDFRLDNDVREGNVSHALDRLRHAADEKELELNFAKALRLLDLIESEYRVYHTTATHAADKHPVSAEDEHRHFTFMLCKKFGLVPPRDMVFPTESLEEVEEKKKTQERRLPPSRMLQRGEMKAQKRRRRKRVDLRAPMRRITMILLLQMGRGTIQLTTNFTKRVTRISPRKR